MDHETLLANIERHLKAKKVSADAVSKLAKRPDAIRNLRRRVKGEFDGSMTLDTLIDIARALDVPPWELMRPPGTTASADELRDLIDQRIEERLAAPSNTPKRKIR
jgi:transcriptional regulator with XRE-family HTH domain